jgi:hypothetical protein
LRRGVLAAAAAFVAVLLVGAISGTLELTGDRGSVASQDALAFIDGYFDAFEARDHDALTGLLAPVDPTQFARVCDGTCSYYDSWSFDYHQRNVAYKMAQGTALLSRSCRVTESTNVDVAVTCEYFEHEYVASVVGAPQVRTVARITVTGSGIGAIEFAYDGEAPAHAAEKQFKAWMSRFHPEDWGSVGQRSWSSVGDALTKGELTAEYGDAWAAYLEANDCTYLDNC